MGWNDAWDCHGPAASGRSEFLISRLQVIQILLSAAYRSEEILHKKLLDAVKNIDVCKHSYYKPPEKLFRLISDLHVPSAIPKLSTLCLESGTAMFVDSKFKKSSNGDKIFIVCKRTVCSSTNHLPVEWLNVLRKNKRFRHLLTTVRQENSDDKAENVMGEHEDIGAFVLGSIPAAEKETSTAPTPIMQICNVNLKDYGEAHSAPLRDSPVAHAFTDIVPEYHCYSDDTFRSAYRYRMFLPQRRTLRILSSILLPSWSIWTYWSKIRVKCHFGISVATSRGTANIIFQFERLTFKGKM